MFHTTSDTDIKVPQQHYMNTHSKLGRIPWREEKNWWCLRIPRLGLAWLVGALAETLAEAVPVEIFMVALELA